MSTAAPGCNSLKPKKLPVETPPAPTPSHGYDSQVCGVKFRTGQRRSGLNVNAVSRPRNPALRFAIVMRKRKVGKGEEDRESTGDGRRATGDWRLATGWRLRRNQIHLRRSRRYLGSRFAPVDIHLAPHAERAGEVDARLDREADPGDELPVVVGLIIIDMGARPVQVAVDRMAGPVDEDPPRPTTVRAARSAS
jgi:hypothetical protein